MLSTIIPKQKSLISLVLILLLLVSDCCLKPVSCFKLFSDQETQSQDPNSNLQVFVPILSAAQKWDTSLKEQNQKDQMEKTKADDIGVSDEVQLHKETHKQVHILKTTTRNESFVNGRPVVCSVGRSGVAIKHREGDGISPVGRWRMESVYYRPDRVARPQTRLPVFEMKPNDGWCSNPDHKEYNLFVSYPEHAEEDGEHERLWLSSHVYDILIVTNYNREPSVEYAKGSAIFIHLLARDAQGRVKPTAGCLGLEEADLREVLKDATEQTYWVVE